METTSLDGAPPAQGQETTVPAGASEGVTPAPGSEVTATAVAESEAPALAPAPAPNATSVDAPAPVPEKVTGQSWVTAMLADPDAELPLSVQVAMQESNPDLVTPEALEALPPEHHALVGNMLAQVRNDFQTASEEATKARAELAMERSALAEMQRKLATQGQHQQQLSPQLAQWAETLRPTKEAIEASDPFSPSGQQLRIDALVAQRFAEFSQTLGQIEQANRQAISQQQAAADYQTRHGDLQTYITANEETFMDPNIYPVIQNLVKQHGMEPRQAHEFAMAKILAERETNMAQAALERARALNQPGGKHGPVIPSRPASMSSAQEKAFYQKYPQALERDMATLRNENPTSLG